MSRLCILPLAFVSPAIAQTYSVQSADLGADIVAGWATDVTGDGRVVGACSVEAGRRTFGFVWRDGVVEQLVVPQDGSFANPPRSFDVHHHVSVLTVSDGGYYAGAGGNVNFGFTQQPYFAWLPHPDPYPPQYVAGLSLFNMMVFDIADTSPLITAVGAGMDGGNRRKGFIALLSQTDDVGNPPRITFLPGFGGALGDNSCAFAVNSAGDVVGFGSNASGFHRPFLRPASTGLMSDLGTLGGPSGEAFDISDSGYIVGQADVLPGRPHAFRRFPGGALVDLGTLGGATSAARAVNNAGDVVGESWTADGLVHAFIWASGSMTDLNSRIPPGSGWVLTHASGVNDDGVIVGWGLWQGKTRGFVLVPGIPCYPDCNTDGVLTVADFGCFQTKFVAQDPYADCNTDGGLTVADFGCFQTKFVGGCP